MSKFNQAGAKPAVGTSPITTEQTPSLKTHEGGTGYARDNKSALFLLAVSNFVGEDTFYEKAGARDTRYRDLVRAVAIEDPEWIAGFLKWLRSDANMRSASLVGALEAAKAMIEKGITGARAIVASVLQRADEPGEALAYWTSKYGRSIPKPVKRGVADAAKRLYSQFTLLKYDTASHGFRFGDVLDLTHPTPGDLTQGDLFKYALDRRHGREVEQPTHLPMILANISLRKAADTNAGALLDGDWLKRAGMTWEDAKSLAGSKVDNKKLWEALGPNLGYMALIRNLRNMDEAKVSDAVAKPLAEKIADADQVAKSRQFPFRFLSAYENAPSLRWGYPLEQALQHSLANLPALPGRTLILVDTSSSMGGMTYSARSKVSPIKAAAVFGVALAAKGEQVDLYGFANGDRPFRHDVKKGASVLKEIAAFINRTGEDGHGTNIGGALAKVYNGHDRVVIVSDMQTMDNGVVMNHGGIGSSWRMRTQEMKDVVPANVPIYGFNLGGYQAAAYPSTPNRVEFGSLTDATFKMIPLIESGKNANWPWIDTD